MVTEVQRNKGVLFQCDECKLFYKDKATAEKCQAWCTEHNSCNLDIIKDAVSDAE